MTETRTIWEIIANIPWWVYALFFYIFYISVRAIKPRIVTVKNLIILPSIFIIFSIAGFYASGYFTFIHFLLAVGAGCVGYLLGWWYFRWMKVKAIQYQSKLQLPGTWSVLVMVLVFFLLSYFLGDILTPTAQSIKQPHYIKWLFIIYGVLIGFFIGRLAYALRCLKRGPYL